MPFEYSKLRIHQIQDIHNLAKHFIKSSSINLAVITIDSIVDSSCSFALEYNKDFGYLNISSKTTIEAETS